MLADRQAGELRREAVAFRLRASEFRVELEDRSAVVLELLEDRVVLGLFAAVDLAKLVHLVEKPFPLLLRLEQRLFERTEGVERLLELRRRRLVLRIVLGGLAASDCLRKRRLEGRGLDPEVVVLGAQFGEMLEDVVVLGCRRSQSVDQAVVLGDQGQMGG